MKITAIRIYQVDLPLREGRYNWSGGNFMEVFDSTVVAVETDEGTTGYAECCPLGSAYLPSYGVYAIRPAGGTCAGSHSISRSMSSMVSVWDARYCFDQRSICRAT